MVVLYIGPPVGFYPGSATARNTTHGTLACPIVVAVQSLHLSGTVILSVQCL
jgi:hypothetical protein